MISYDFLLYSKVDSQGGFYLIPNRSGPPPPLVSSHFYGKTENDIFCKVILYINVCAVLYSFVVA